MSYNFTIARISSDLKKSIAISENEWKECQIDEELIYSKKSPKNTYNCLEVLTVTSNDFIPCFWIRDDFETAHADCIILSMDSRIEKYAIHIATKLNAIIFGEEGELFFIPGIGKLQKDIQMHCQININLSDLIENDLTLNTSDHKKIDLYIKMKIKEANSQI